METLFSPARIKDLKLRNRVVALPVFTGYALPDGRVSPLMFEHYRRLAKSGAAMVIVPNIAVVKNGRTSERSLFLGHDRQTGELKRLADVIKSHNAVACIQLNHAGRYAVCDHPMLPSAMNAEEIVDNMSPLKNFMESFPLSDRFGLTAHLAKMTAGWTHEMEEADIRQTIVQFGDAACRAFQAGFDMIELHGATGYLIAQFLSPRTNRRPSPWGGTAKERMAFPLKIINEIKNRIPDRVPIGFRLIADEMVTNGITPSQGLEFAEQLEKNGVDYLSATIGTYQSMFLPDVAKRLSRPGYLVDLTAELKKRVAIPVIASGRIISPALAEKMITKNQADLIGLGRPLLADSKWVVKAKTNHRIIGCKNCNTCFKNVAIGESVICDRWPRVVKNRVRLETRFTSRSAYRFLIVLSSISDIQTSKKHARQRAPIHEGILDRQLFLDTGEEPGFSEAAQAYINWSKQSFHALLGRGRVENVFIGRVQDPIQEIMAQLKDNFGFVCIGHEQASEWKKKIMRDIPADVVAFRVGSHPNTNKVMIPCDLSPFTHMQIRVARHIASGRGDTQFHFVHVSRSLDDAGAKWQRMLEGYNAEIRDQLTILSPVKNQGVADVLLKEAHKGQYGCLILGRRGGLAKARRRIFGSVSETLLDALPGRTFGIVG